MINWLNFFLFLFWIIFAILLSNNLNFINTMIAAELVWIILYNITILFGVLNDDLILFSLSFFILALAGLEFSIGFLLVIIFRFFYKTLNFNEIQKISNNQTNDFANSSIKRYTLL